MVSHKAINAPRAGRPDQVKDSGCKSLIREERVKDAFPFPGSVKSRIGLLATLSKFRPGMEKGLFINRVCAGGGK